MLHHNNSAGAFAKTVFGALILACAVAPLPAFAEYILVTQYKADPSGAPYGVAIDKGFFKAAGVDITGVISGEGGGSSVRAVIASDLGYGEIAVGTRAVLDDHRPATGLLQIVRDQPCRNVGRAARRDRHQHPDRPCWVLRLRCGSGENGEGKRTGT